jgi:hypothetical protein
MNEKLPAVALALAAVVAVAAGGVAALDASAPGPDAQDDEHPTTVDGYEFAAVADHDDWLADRDADASTLADRLLAGETGEAVREQFDAGEPLALDVYGSLQSEPDRAHVVVTPAPVLADSDVSEQEPRVEATVNPGEDTATLVGVSAPSDGSDATTVRNASEVDDAIEVTAENATGDSFTVAADDDDGATVLSTGNATTVTLDGGNVTLVERD